MGINNFSLDDSVSDILRNKEFLWKLRSFLKANEIDVDKNDLKSILDFFREDKEWLSVFLLSFAKMNKEKVQVFLESFDYALEINEKSDKYPKEFDFYKNKISTKVIDILGRKIENASVLLASRWFPTITSYETYLIWVDFNDKLDYFGDEYVRVQDSQKQFIYINKNWKILSDTNWDFIDKIEYSFIFWDNLVYSFHTNKWENKLWVIKPATSEDEAQIPFEYLDSYASLSSLKFDKLKNWLDLLFVRENRYSIYDNNFIQKRDNTYLFKDNLEKLSILDLISYLSNWNNVFNKKFAEYNEIYPYDIINKYEIEWELFIKIKIFLEWEFKNVIMHSSGELLYEKKDDYKGSILIDEIYDDVAEIFGKTFLEYSVVNKNLDNELKDNWKLCESISKDLYIDDNEIWFLDKNFKVLKYLEEKIFSIEELKLKMWWETIFRINKKHHIKQSDLENILSNYTSFSTPDIEIEEITEEELEEISKKSKLNFISRNANNNWTE